MISAYFRPLIFCFCAVFLAACDQGGSVSGKVTDARARNDGPAIWKVKDFDSELYLYGTVHLLSAEIDWMRDDMASAFREAGTVFFEVDTGTNGQIKASVLTQSLGFYKDGRRLQDRLDSYQLKLLEAAAHNSGIAVETLNNMKPWLASEFLTVAAGVNAGLSPELSADNALKSRAEQQQKNILYFETIEDQLRRTAGQAESVQMMMLSDTLEGYNGLGDDLNDVAKSWAIGRTDYLTTNVVNAVRDRSPEIYKSLYADVNQSWGKTLVKFMEGSETGFAAIGIGHLLGEDSLIEVLREQGYQVSRHYAFKGKPVIKPVFETAQ